MYLKGKNINLRALELEDLDFLYEIENNEFLWDVSNTIQPYSKWVLKNYLKNAHLDIFNVKQLRLVIENQQKNTCGLIDLFDFDPINKRAGLGIVILEAFQNKKLASEALELMIGYCFSVLQLHQIFVNITEDNAASLKLFSNFGFELVGVKKDWIHNDAGFKNELLFQLIKSKY